jgi:hypothetical protein
MKILTSFLKKNKFLLLFILILGMVSVWMYYNMIFNIIWLVDSQFEWKIPSLLQMELINIWIFVSIWLLLCILNYLIKINIKVLFLYIISYSLVYLFFINTARDLL